MAHIPDEKFEQLCEDVRDIKTVLKGYDGYPGLCQRYENLANDHYALRRLVIGLIWFLVGVGILTGGGFGIAQLIGG